MNFESPRRRIERIAQPIIEQLFGSSKFSLPVGDQGNPMWVLKIVGKPVMEIEIDVEKTDQEIDSLIRSEIGRQS